MDIKYDTYKQQKIRAAWEEAARYWQEAERCRREIDAIALRIGDGERVVIGVPYDGPYKREMAELTKLHDDAAVARRNAIQCEIKAKEIKESNAIYSDDPNALEKIEERIMQLSYDQHCMVAINKMVRTGNLEQFLALPGATEELWQALTTPNIFGRIGISAEKLRYNNRQLAHWKKRKAILVERAQAKIEYTELQTLFIPVIKSTSSHEYSERTQATVNPGYYHNHQALR